jgi:hypothetical protein
LSNVVFLKKKKAKLVSLKNKNKNFTNALKNEKCGLAFLSFKLAYSKVCSTIQLRTAILAHSQYSGKIKPW